MILLNIVDFSNPMTIVSLVLSVLVSVCLIVFLAAKTNRRFTLIFYPIAFVFLFNSYSSDMRVYAFVPVQITFHVDGITNL